MEDIFEEKSETPESVWVWSLSNRHRNTIGERIIDALDAEEVSKAFKKALDHQVEKAVDELTWYVKDEFQCLLADLVRQRASDLVEQLLKGNEEIGQAFNLAMREYNGAPYASDPKGIRRSIYEAFKPQIEAAEIVSLRDDNEHLRATLRILRER